MISPTAGIEEGLNELEKREDFTAMLEEEVNARGLTVQGAMASFYRPVPLVSTPFLIDAHSTIIVPKANLTDKERAALVILFKVQERFPKPFWLNKDTSGEKDEN